MCLVGIFCLLVFTALLPFFIGGAVFFFQFVIAIFTAVGYFLHWWFRERKNANEQSNQTQPSASTTIANPTCPPQPTTVSMEQAAIPEAVVIWVSPQPSAPPLPHNYVEGSK